MKFDSRFLHASRLYWNLGFGLSQVLGTRLSPGIGYYFLPTASGRTARKKLFKYYPYAEVDYSVGFGQNLVSKDGTYAYDVNIHNYINSGVGVKIKKVRASHGRVNIANIRVFAGYSFLLHNANIDFSGINSPAAIDYKQYLLRQVQSSFTLAFGIGIDIPKKI